ncbi:hypothetical protein [uncultured Helicobacter sp.]|uniref:hypothetical protein n=1 Tax=uncultured Helicobacter sp. TaxID=175537 RepID=UPI00374F9322
MTKRTNYQKKQITGKRTHLILSIEAYKALQSQMNTLGLQNTTKYIESLLLLAQTQDIAKTEKILDKLINLINFNKKLYMDLNATFSNINQIAYKLNLAFLNNELDSVADALQNEIKTTLAQTKEDLADLRIIVKNLIHNLDKKYKTLYPYQEGENNE